MRPFASKSSEQVRPAMLKLLRVGGTVAINSDDFGKSILSVEVMAFICSSMAIVPPVQQKYDLPMPDTETECKQCRCTYLQALAVEHYNDSM